jgi:septal ring factor EnvC (AmiA/AmiB activator)
MSDESHPRSLWGIIGICATVAVTSATAGWVVARAYLSDELEQIRRSRDWHLPENLAALGEVSKRVTLQLDERHELERSRQQIPQLKRELAATNSRLAVAQATAERLHARLMNLEGNTFELREGDARFIVPGQLALGVDSLYSINHSASVHLGKQSATLRPGEPIETEVGGVKYTIVFLRTDGQVGLFSVSSAKP